MAGPGQDHAFAREEVYPSWFANRIQDMLSAGKFDLPLSRKNATTIQVVPDAILGIAAVNIKGRWRFNTAAIERVVTGAKATYGIWAVAEDNSINNTPNPFTDHTVYTFELRVSATEPAVGAGTAIATKIGEVDWSGTEIETIRQNRGAVTGAQIADGAMSSAGSAIEWTREPNGALVPNIKKESIAEDRLASALQAKLQAGGVAGHFWNEGVLTRTGAAFGAFSTPVVVPLAKVAPDQAIRVHCSFLALGSGAPTMQIAVGGVGIGGTYTPPNEAKWFRVATTKATGESVFNSFGLTFAEAEAKSLAATWASANATLLGEHWYLKHKSAEEKPLTVELLGKIPTGEMKILGVYLSASVVA